MDSSRVTLVLGASESTFRYSYLATNRLLSNNENVFLLGKRKGEVLGKTIHTEWPEEIQLHTITLYLNPGHQEAFYQQIIDAMPQRVIFNPGTENQELAGLLTENNIQFEYACTLVLLATGQY